MPDQDPKYDAGEAAAYLSPHLSPKTLANWRVQGRGPRFLKVGGRVVYRKSDLDRFLAQCERSSTTEHRSQVA